jgi:hypothetical protein
MSTATRLGLNSSSFSLDRNLSLYTIPAVFLTAFLPHTVKALWLGKRFDNSNPRGTLRLHDNDTPWFKDTIVSFSRHYLRARTKRKLTLWLLLFSEPIDRHAPERHGELATLLHRCPRRKLRSSPCANHVNLLSRLLRISTRLQLHLLHSTNRQRRKYAIVDILCRSLELVLDHYQEWQQGLRFGLKEGKAPNTGKA